MLRYGIGNLLSLVKQPPTAASAEHEKLLMISKKIKNKVLAHPSPRADTRGGGSPMKVWKEKKNMIPDA